MGLFDISQRVVTFYKADTSDHKAKIRELSGEQKKLAKEQLDALEKQNKNVQSNINAIGKLAAGFAGVGVAITAVEAVFEHFTWMASSQARSLREEMKRLGADGVSDFAKMGDAVESLNSRLKLTEGILSALDKQMAAMGGLNRNAALDKSFSGLSRSTLESIVERESRKLNDESVLGFDSFTSQIDAAKAAGDSMALLKIEEARVEATERRAAAQRAINILIAAEAEAQRKAEAARGKGGGGYSLGGTNAQDSGGARDITNRYSSGASINSIAVNAGFLKSNAPLDFASALGGPDSTLEADLSKRNTERRKEGEKSKFLESIFGAPDEFDMYREQFALLTGAIEGSFGAWVDGSMTAGEAAKKMFRDILGAEAKLMFGKAITHGAMALGEWAWGNNAKAAKHGAAALKFAAGAVAVGAVARQLGGSGASGGGASAGGGGSAAYGGQRGPDTGGSVSIYVGDDWASKSSRERATMAREVWDEARRGGSGSSSIVRHG